MNHKPSERPRSRPRTNDCRFRWNATFIGLFIATVLTLPSQHAFAQDGLAKESFVPADQLEAIFNRTPNGMMLPRDRFDELLSLAQEAQKKNADIPSTAVVRSANYKIVRDGTHAVIDAEIEVEQFVNDWASIQLSIGNMLIEDARIGKEPAAVSISSRGELTLLHETAERFTLKLRLSTPLGSVGNDSFAAIRITHNVPTNVEVECPARQVVVFNDLKLRRPDKIDAATTYEIPTGNHKDIRLKWTSEESKNEMQRPGIRKYRRCNQTQR